MEFHTKKDKGGPEGYNPPDPPDDYIKNYQPAGTV